MRTINVIVERNPFQVTSKPGSLTNFIVNEPDYEGGSIVGYGPTLELALNAFEVMYECRHNEECKAVIVEQAK